MSNFVLCWLHHCTDRSEKQVQNDREFITLMRKLDVQFISRSDKYRETCRAEAKIG